LANDLWPAVHCVLAVHIVHFVVYLRLLLLFNPQSAIRHPRSFAVKPNFLLPAPAPSFILLACPDQ